MSFNLTQVFEKQEQIKKKNHEYVTEYSFCVCVRGLYMSIHGELLQARSPGIFMTLYWHHLLWKSAKRSV